VGGAGQSGSGGVAGGGGTAGESCGMEECPPDFSPCFDESSQFGTCDEVCAAQGETCARGTCGGIVYATVAAWPTLDDCNGYNVLEVNLVSDGPCGDPIVYSADNAVYRCCCTVTP